MQIHTLLCPSTTNNNTWTVNNQHVYISD